MKRDESAFRMAQLKRIIIGLPTWYECTRHERRIVLAQMLYEDLLIKRKPDLQEVPGECEE